MGEVKVSLCEARRAWKEPLESVFPTRAAAPMTAAPYVPYERREEKRPAVRVARPRVFIPSFPGTNCEMDSARAFRRAGAEVETFIFKNLTPRASRNRRARSSAAFKTRRS